MLGLQLRLTAGRNALYFSTFCVADPQSNVVCKMHTLEERVCIKMHYMRENNMQRGITLVEIACKNGYIRQSCILLMINLHWSADESS